ncbi:hypothetical protein UJ101_01719 [Flavobacteriaceae bacterium UJ101]|nr:hypothetical protein UJ101_01719 [Flavobacteriaceae bacterium UJ101]
MKKIYFLSIIILLFTGIGKAQLKLDCENLMILDEMYEVDKVPTSLTFVGVIRIKNIAQDNNVFLNAGTVLDLDQYFFIKNVIPVVLLPGASGTIPIAFELKTQPPIGEYKFDLSFLIPEAENRCGDSVIIKVVDTLAKVDELNCSNAAVTGSLAEGSAASGVSFSVPYTGGNGGIYGEQTIRSTGVTGLTAKLEAGSLVDGSGSVTYTVEGTPSSSGVANFDIDLGGKSCTVSIPVGGDCDVVVTNFSGTTWGTTSNVQRVTDQGGGYALGWATKYSGKKLYTKLETTPGKSYTVSFKTKKYVGGDKGSVRGKVYAASGSIGGKQVNSASYEDWGYKWSSNFTDRTFLFVADSNVTYLVFEVTSNWKSKDWLVSEVNIGCNNTANVEELNCSGKVVKGSLTEGVTASDVSFDVPYTGGNGVRYEIQTVSSTGVTGLTAKLEAGNLAVGSGNLTYTVEGVPSSSGTASFKISIGNKTCTVTVPVFKPCESMISNFSGVTWQMTSNVQKVTDQGGGYALGWATKYSGKKLYTALETTPGRTYMVTFKTKKYVGGDHGSVYGKVYAVSESMNGKRIKTSSYKDWGHKWSSNFTNRVFTFTANSNKTYLVFEVTKNWKSKDWLVSDVNLRCSD